MGDITETALRDSVVDFSYPYFFTRVGFFTRKRHQFSRNKIERGGQNMLLDGQNYYRAGS